MKRKVAVIFFVLLIVLLFMGWQIYRENKINDLYEEDQKEKIKDLKYDKINVSFIEKSKVDRSAYIVFEGTIIDKDGKIINYWTDRKSYISLLDNGDIIAARNPHVLVQPIGRYTWDDETVWERDDLVVHHDIELTDYGTLLTATKEVYLYRNRLVEFDVILELNLTNGELISNYSTWDHLNELKPYYKPLHYDNPDKEIPLPKGDYSKRYPGDYDYFHLNSISIIQENKNENDIRFQKGNWLISLRTPNLVLILDKDTKEVVWTYGPEELEGQHNPIILPSGNMIIYDNGKPSPDGRNFTRVIEINPLNKEVVWEYNSSFMAAIVGTAQRLENGNTLITYGTEANAFEITSEGEKVWEFWTPNRYLNRSEISDPYNFIYRAEVYEKDYIDKIIKNVKKTKYL